MEAHPLKARIAVHISHSRGTLWLQDGITVGRPRKSSCGDEIISRRREGFRRAAVRRMEDLEAILAEYGSDEEGELNLPAGLNLEDILKEADDDDDDDGRW